MVRAQLQAKDHCRRRPEHGGAGRRSATRIVGKSQTSADRAPGGGRLLFVHALRERGPTEISLALRTSCDGPPATSTDCSIRDGAVTSPVAARSLQ